MSTQPDVLVVEDNPQNYELVEFLLEDAGYRVRWAADASAMLNELAAATPDLILMDIQLPGVDGLALVAQIRGTAGGSEIPIVALTAHAMRGDRERFLQAGCDGYIAKPVDVGSFAGLVETYLAGGRRSTP